MGAATSVASSAYSADALPYANINVQQFGPNAATSLNYNHLSGADTLGHLGPSVGLWLNYAHRPLTATLGDGSQVDLLAGQLQADLVAGIGLGPRFQLGLAIPLTLMQATGSSTVGGYPLPVLASTVPGDMRLVPRFQLLKADTGLNLALEGIVGLPTGDPNNMQGSGSVTFEPRVVAEVKANERLRAGLNLGYTLRNDHLLYNLTIGNELTFGLGAAYALVPDKVTLLAEVFGRAAADGDSTAQLETTPIEGNVAGRFNLGAAHALTVGVGPGLSEGYGAPTFRVFAGYAFTPPRVVVPPDTDGDGMVDKEDSCPKEAEDFDKFQDQDGCPDVDNDADGVLDASDVCPNEAEDKDSFKDEDGCPDPDNDDDRVLDSVDKCPDSKEDHDGMFDSDGCLDPDNDEDGILDGADKCPNKPEDKDGLGDEDGCPEEDFDKDGFPDTADKCPTQPETINGNQDDDGCPDEGKSKVEVSKDRVEILEQVYFDTAKDTIQKRSFPLLKQVALVLKANPEITRLRVEGHTDNVGDDAANLDLSKRRAESVRQFLIAEGIDAARLNSEGFGETQPIADNKTDKGRQLNRRVVFTITELNGAPVEAKVIEKTTTGDQPADVKPVPEQK